MIYGVESSREVEQAEAGDLLVAYCVLDVDSWQTSPVHNQRCNGLQTNDGEVWYN